MKISDAGLDYLAELDFDPVYSAKTLKPAISRYLETALTKSILRDEDRGRDTINACRQKYRSANSF